MSDRLIRLPGSQGNGAEQAGQVSVGGFRDPGHARAGLLETSGTGQDARALAQGCAVGPGTLQVGERAVDITGCSPEACTHGEEFDMRWVVLQCSFKAPDGISLSVLPLI